jgi:F0F1-type ATP synthase assembly protein I
MADDNNDKTLRGRDLVGLGGVLVGSVVLGLVIGLVVDDKAGTSPVFSLVGIGLGIVAGGIAFWLKVRSVLRP